jgi:hypothetical protein
VRQGFSAVTLSYNHIVMPFECLFSGVNISDVTKKINAWHLLKKQCLEPLYWLGDGVRLSVVGFLSNSLHINHDNLITMHWKQWINYTFFFKNLQFPLKRSASREEPLGPLTIFLTLLSKRLRIWGHNKMWTHSTVWLSPVPLPSAYSFHECSLHAYIH